MFILDWVGAALTLVTLGFLLLGGYLLALAALGEQVGRDRLLLGAATLLLSTAQAVVVATLLGALGALRLPWALALQAVLVVVLLRRARRRPPPGGVEGPVLEVFRHGWSRVREHPILCLIVAHAVASEALRGLLRTSLSWDSLMYHLLLAGTWLRDGNLFPVFGNIPINYYGYVPANGSLWLWWWMAPSHSELYVNLAALPHWVLLGLGVGAVARHLGAERSWPIASLLTLVTPTVVRFVATQYVDILLGAAILAAVVFALRWLDEPRLGDAALAGIGLGLAAGTKVLGAVYAAFLVAAVLLLARREWGRRVAHVGAALGLAALLGSFFYLRNVALGVDPLAIQCEMTSSGPQNANVPSIPRKNSVLDLPELMIGQGQLLDAFLGVTRLQSLELGVGPAAFLLLLAVVALPWGLAPEKRRVGLVIALQIGLELAFWLAVPFAKDRHVFANVRYLIPALGLAAAAGLAMLERRSAASRWLPWIGLVVAIQALLQLHAEMPRGVRLALAAVDVSLVALALSERTRRLARRRWREIAAGVGALCFLLVPWWAQFRVTDRGRAYTQELTAHLTTARFQAKGWDWLDRHGGNGNVAAMVSPNSYFIYPAMGPRLERDVRVVNVNRADLPLAAAYPKCEPRVDPDPRAWLDGLARHRIRWVHLSRFPRFELPLEDGWARRMPELFALRFEDETNVVYEFLPAAESD